MDTPEMYVCTLFSFVLLCFILDALHEINVLILVFFWRFAVHPCTSRWTNVHVIFSETLRQCCENNFQPKWVRCIWIKWSSIWRHFTKMSYPNWKIKRQSVRAILKVCGELNGKTVRAMIVCFLFSSNFWTIKNRVEGRGEKFEGGT